MSFSASLEYFSAGVTNFVFDQEYDKKITKNIRQNVEVNNGRKTPFLVWENLWKEILSYVKPSFDTTTPISIAVFVLSNQ